MTSSSLQVYVLQDTELMRFVFDRDPNFVSQRIDAFQEDLGTLFPQPLKFHLYENEFYSKVDGSIDFGRTSSCFQLMKEDDVIDLKSTESMLDFTTNPDLKDVFDRHNVVGVERCATIKSTRRINWVQICLLAIAALIFLISFIAACVVCCLFNR